MVRARRFCFVESNILVLISLRALTPSAELQEYCGRSFCESLSHQLVFPFCGNYKIGNWLLRFRILSVVLSTLMKRALTQDIGMKLGGFEP